MPRLVFSLLLLMLVWPTVVFAQGYSLLKDEKGLAQVQRITHLIYNTQHKEADKELESLKKQVPLSHPVHPLLQAINLYWEDAPMHTGSPHFKEFIQLLHQTNKQAELYIDKEIDFTVSTFSALTAHSLLTRYHAEKGDYMAALKEARPTYAYMKDGFELKDQYNEFFFSVGLYNYYRVKYPELHPVYKPFMWLFQDGNKTLGLQQIEYAARNTVFTKVEAGVFLVHLYLYYENKPQKALQSIQQLQHQFPANPFIKLQLAESLIANRQYTEASPYIDDLLENTDPYYRAAAELFKGMIEEKLHQNFNSAYTHYTEALKIAQSLNYIADTYRSMAYAGQARYFEAKQQKEKAQAAWQQALKLAVYEYPVKPEAKKHLE